MELLTFITFFVAIQIQYFKPAVSNSCNANQTANCSFKVNRDCIGWVTNTTNVTWENIAYRTPGSIRVPNGSWIETREKACSTVGNQPHCLIFWAMIRIDGNTKPTATISVDINGQEVTTFNISKNGTWENCTTNITSNDAFSVNISVISTAAIFINEIEYTKSPCFASNDTWDYTDDNAGDNNSSTSSRGIIAAVVIILILIIIAVVVIVVLFRQGRLQFLKSLACVSHPTALQCGGSNDDDKQSGHESASSSAPTTTATTITTHRAHPANGLSISSPKLEDSTHPTEDLYSIIKDDGDTTAPGSGPVVAAAGRGHVNARTHRPTVTNQTHKPKDGPSSGEREPQDIEGIYHTIDDRAADDAAHVNAYKTPKGNAEASRYINTPVGIYHTVEGTGKTSPSQPPTSTGAGVYHVLEADALSSGQGRSVYHLASVPGDTSATSSAAATAKGPGPQKKRDDYNSLDFDGKMLVVQATRDGGKVYNHLTDEDDAYNQTGVVGEKKIVDQDYSRIQ